MRCRAQSAGRSVLLDRPAAAPYYPVWFDDEALCSTSLPTLPWHAVPPGRPTRRPRPGRRTHRPRSGRRSCRRSGPASPGPGTGSVAAVEHAEAAASANATAAANDRTWADFLAAAHTHAGAGTADLDAATSATDGRAAAGAGTELNDRPFGVATRADARWRAATRVGVGAGPHRRRDGGPAPDAHAPRDANAAHHRDANCHAFRGRRPAPDACG